MRLFRKRQQSTEDLRLRFYAAQAGQKGKEEAAALLSAVNGRISNLSNDSEKVKRHFQAMKARWNDAPPDVDETPALNQEEHTDAKRYRWGAMLSVALEMALGVYLTVSGMRVPWILGVFIGILGAIALTLVFKAAPFGVLVDKDNPAKSFRRLRIISFVLAFLCAICLLPWFFSRTLTLFGWLLPWTASICALLLPGLSAALLCAAELKDYSRRNSDLYSKLTQERDELIALRTQINDYLRESEEPAEVAVRRGTRTPEKVVRRAKKSVGRSKAVTENLDTGEKAHAKDK